MTETISFSLPKEMVDAIRRYATGTERKGSKIAEIAFREFFSKPEIQRELTETENSASTEKSN